MITYKVFDFMYHDYITFETLDDAKEYIDDYVYNHGNSYLDFRIYKCEMLEEYNGR